eukprot:s2923_g9.t1
MWILDMIVLVITVTDWLSSRNRKEVHRRFAASVLDLKASSAGVVSSVRHELQFMSDADKAVAEERRSGGTWYGTGCSVETPLDQAKAKAFLGSRMVEEVERFGCCLKEQMQVPKGWAPESRRSTTQLNRLLRPCPKPQTRASRRSC